MGHHDALWGTRMHCGARGWRLSTRTGHSTGTAWARGHGGDTEENVGWHGDVAAQQQGGTTGVGHEDVAWHEDIAWHENMAWHEDIAWHEDMAWHEDIAWHNDIAWHEDVV